MDHIDIVIDGVNVKAEKGQSILDAALDAGIYIPHICSHPDLSPQGECKLCVVETGGETVLSCMTEAESGMNVVTKTEQLNHLRVTALELMLASHPHDCTSCVVYLNCELQAMMQYLSAAHSRLRTVKKKNLNLNTGNPLIIREMERCIQCGRCVRACRELRDVGILDYRKKNDETYIGTEGDLKLIEANCRFCGACIEVCPTGALRDSAEAVVKNAPAEITYVPCRHGCPAGIDVPRYVRLTKEGRYSDAAAVVREKAPFPEVLGNICSRLCELECKRNSLNESPVSIRNLKRFAAENDHEKIWKKNHKIKPASGKKAAIIGAGPCGMTAAYYLALSGHEVTVFERQPEAGGMLSYGIPEYRLPRDVIRKEMAEILEDGITLKTSENITSTDELLDNGFDAVLIAAGASSGKKVPLPGHENAGVYTAIEILQKASMGNVPELGKTVAVLGGGNVAFDAARVCTRIGVENVKLICLEKAGAMCADDVEVIEGREEGIEILNSKSLLSIEAENGHAIGVMCVDVEDFSFSPEGQLQLKKIEGSEALVEADSIIFATGQKTDLDSNIGVNLNRFGFVINNPEDYSTGKEGVFAAGDVVTGTRFVIEAVNAGRKAASKIDLYLGGDGDIAEILTEKEVPDGKVGKIDGFGSLHRIEPAVLDEASRCGNFKCVDLGFSTDQAGAESERCLQCDLRNHISGTKMWTDFIKN